MTAPIGKRVRMNRLDGVNDTGVVVGEYRPAVGPKHVCPYCQCEPEVSGMVGWWVIESDYYTRADGTHVQFVENPDTVEVLE